MERRKQDLRALKKITSTSSEKYIYIHSHQFWQQMLRTSPKKDSDKEGVIRLQGIRRVFQAFEAKDDPIPCELRHVRCSKLKVRQEF